MYSLHCVKKYFFIRDRSRLTIQTRLFPYYNETSLKYHSQARISKQSALYKNK